MRKRKEREKIFDDDCNIFYGKKKTTCCLPFQFLILQYLNIDHHVSTEYSASNGNHYKTMEYKNHCIVCVHVCMLDSLTIRNNIVLNSIAE